MAPGKPEIKTGTDNFLPLTPALMGDPFTPFVASITITPIAKG
jgi:hypothetical protein